MIRVRTLLVTFLPALTVGGLLLSSAPGLAQTGNDDGFWPAAGDTATGAPGAVIAQADPRPHSHPRPPSPPSPPSAPSPPSPPSPPSGHRRGMSISIHDGKIEIDGIADMVQEQLDRVAEILDNQPDVPPEVRARVKNRIKAVRNRVSARLSKLKTLDLDKIGPEMERMGDEIEKEMEGLDSDLQQFGEKFGKNFAAKFGKDFGKDFGKGFAKSFTPPNVPHATSRRDDNDGDDGDDDDGDDDDDKAAVTMPPDGDTDAGDPSDMRDAIANLKKLSMTLDQDQKAKLAKLRIDSDQQVKLAKRDLEELSNRLHDSLGDASVSESDIARQIDQISTKEATIRKARVLAWVRARSLLRKDQRNAVETAVKKSH